MWRIPGSRMKMQEDHDQPLSEAALEVLERARGRTTTDQVWSFRPRTNLASR